MTVTRPVDPCVGWPARPERARPRLGVVELFIGLLLVAVHLRGWLVAATNSARGQTRLTIFVSIVIQSSRFVVLGAVVSAAIAALGSPSFIAPAPLRRLLHDLPAGPPGPVRQSTP